MPNPKAGFGAHFSKSARAPNGKKRMKREFLSDLSF
jgi:hypothetical protein